MARTREEAIQIINGLYPTDSEYERTNAIGVELLEQAKRNVENWRDLPDNILFEYCQLCEQKESDENRRYNEAIRSQS